MTEILQMFQGNPMATYIGKKVEAATRPELESEDWSLNLEICDIINDNDDDAKDAVRAIKKRLQQIEQDRNFLVTNRTLTVLETCVNNCSRRFHVLVMTKDFIQDLVKLIGPKNNPPIDLQERVLRLIERWADAFRNQPDLSGVVSVYNELKSKGVTFPPKDETAAAPIQTPQRSVPTVQTNSTRGTNAPSGARSEDAPGAGHLSSAAPTTGPTVLAGEGYSKITQDLSVVQTSIDMLNDLMQQLESNNDEADWTLAADLNTTCRQMKDRIVELIERVANEDLTIELLRLNDDLNNIFIKYDRLVKKRNKQASLEVVETGSRSTAGTESNAPKPTTSQGPRLANEMSLIDFNPFDDTSGNDRSAIPTLAPTKVTDTQTTSSGTAVPPTTAFPSSGQLGDILDPFDSSAVSRAMSSLETTTKSASDLTTDLSRLNIDQKSKPKSPLPDEISSVREQDFAELERWLRTDSVPGATSMSSLEPTSMQNPEFENFIANRALAGSSNQTRVGPNQTQGNTNSGKKPEPAT